MRQFLGTERISAPGNWMGHQVASTNVDVCPWPAYVHRVIRSR